MSISLCQNNNTVPPCFTQNVSSHTVYKTPCDLSSPPSLTPQPWSPTLSLAHVLESPGLLTSPQTTWAHCCLRPSALAVSSPESPSNRRPCGPLCLTSLRSYSDVSLSVSSNLATLSKTYHTLPAHPPRHIHFTSSFPAWHGCFTSHHITTYLARRAGSGGCAVGRCTDSPCLEQSGT